MITMIEIIKSDLLKIKLEHKNFLKLVRIFSLTVGIDIRRPTRFWHPFKIVLLILLINAVIIFTALFNHILDNLHLSVFHYVDSFCVAAQLTAAIIKELCVINKHNGLYEIVKMAENSHILLTLEIFHLELNITEHYVLWRQIKNIIKKSWLDIECQLRFFIYSVCLTSGWYVCTALVINIYHLYYKDRYDDGSFKMAFLPICFDCIFVIAVIHCSALLHILRILIQHSTSLNVPQHIRLKYILCCIRFHQKIYNYQLLINDLYMHITFAQHNLNIIILCIIMFQFNAFVDTNFNLTLKALMYFTSVLWQNVLYCWNAQKLITESNLLRLSWYECQWYNESKEFQCLIQMMIMRTNRLLFIRLSNFGVMSMVTLLSLFRKSYSFFLLLNNVSGNN